MPPRKRTSTGQNTNKASHYEERPPFNEIIKLKRPKGLPEKGANDRRFAMKKEAILMELLLESFYKMESLETICKILQILTQSDHHCLYTAPYVGIEILKRSKEVSTAKLFQFVSLANELSLLTDHANLLYGRFIYEYVVVSDGRNMLSLYNRLNNAITVGLSTKDNVQTNKNIVSIVFCGILEYLMWSVMKFENIKKKHDQKLSLENRLKIEVDQTIVNFQNLRIDDARLCSFTDWSNKSGLTLVELESRAMKHLCFIKLLSNVPLTYVKAYVNLSLLTNYLKKREMGEFLESIHYKNPYSLDILEYLIRLEMNNLKTFRYCTKMSLKLFQDVGLKYLWKLLEMDPFNPLFDKIFNVDVENMESRDYLFEYVTETHQCLNLIRVLFKRLSIFHNANNLKDLRLLKECIAGVKNNSSFAVIWSKNIFSWNSYIDFSSQLMLKPECLVLRTKIKHTVEKALERNR